jgi:hypothetical protein
MVGVAGPAGSAGGVGSQGPMGMTGDRGPMATNSNWNASWDYTFNGDSNEILRFDQGKAGDIASYMDRDQARRIGLDGADARRVEVIREALITAGVPASKIQSGAFGDPQKRRYGRVAVLVSN